MDLRKQRRKERRLKKKNRKGKKRALKKKELESYSYNWCIHDDCLLSLHYFKTEEELHLHIEKNHSK